MNVSLTAELEQLVARKVKSGMYQTASEVVREALCLLRERDEVREGFAQIERGEYTEYREEGLAKLAGVVKARGMKRLSQRKGG